MLNTYDRGNHSNKNFDLMLKRLENKTDYLSVNQIMKKYGLTVNQVSKKIAENNLVCENENSRIKGSPRYYDLKEIERVFGSGCSDEDSMYPENSIDFNKEVCEKALVDVSEEVKMALSFLDSDFIQQMQEYGISKDEIQRIKFEKVFNSLKNIEEIVGVFGLPF